MFGQNPPAIGRADYPHPRASPLGLSTLGDGDATAPFVKENTLIVQVSTGATRFESGNKLHTR